MSKNEAISQPTPLKVSFEFQAKEIIKVMDEKKEAWTSHFIKALSAPANLVTKQKYSGCNLMNLTLQGLSKPSRYWLTEKQIKELKGKLKSGVRGVVVYYIGSVQKEVETGEDTEEVTTTMEEVKFLKKYTVFNASDTTLNYPDKSSFKDKVSSFFSKKKDEPLFETKEKELNEYREALKSIYSNLDELDNKKLLDAVAWNVLEENAPKGWDLVKKAFCYEIARIFLRAHFNIPTPVCIFSNNIEDFKKMLTAQPTMLWLIGNTAMQCYKMSLEIGKMQTEKEAESA